MTKRLFVEAGLHNTGIARISSTSGIAVGQIYRDFANKDAIISAIIKDSLSEWLREKYLYTAVDSEDETAIRKWVDHICFDGHAFEDRQLLCALLAEVGHNPQMAEMHRDAERRLRSALDLALSAIAREASSHYLRELREMIIMFSWGMMARKVLSPDAEYKILSSCASQIVAEKLRKICSD